MSRFGPVRRWVDDSAKALQQRLGGMSNTLLTIVLVPGYREDAMAICLPYDNMEVDAICCISSPEPAITIKERKCTPLAFHTQLHPFGHGP